MEVIELADGGLIPISNASNFFVQPMQSFTPTHFINDSGGLEVIDELQGTSTAHCTADGSFLQVIEPSPTVIVNYVFGPDGSLIPIYDSFPSDNTVTIITAGPDSPPEQAATVPPHILDHMYAKKPKDPSVETQSKPRKRVKKKEQPVVTEYTVPEILPNNTTKVNIIRKGLPIAPTTANLRPLISRPKILQTKSMTSCSPLLPQKTVNLISSSAPKVHSLSSNTTTSSSSSVTSANRSTVVRGNSRGNVRSSSGSSSTSSPGTTTTSVYLAPELNLEANFAGNDGTSSGVPIDDSEGGGGGGGGTTSFYLTTLNEPVHDGAQVLYTTTPSRKSGSRSSSSGGSSSSNSGLCFMLPTSSSSIAASTVSSSCTPSTNMSDNNGGGVKTYQLSDSTFATITRSESKDETVITYTEHESDMFNTDFSIQDHPAADDATVIQSSETVTSMQLGGTPIYFSYAEG